MDIRKGIVAICANEGSKQAGIEYAGTGFVVSGGWLVTCAHVLSGARRDAGRIFFKQEPSHKEYSALILDESTDYILDVAVLKPESLPEELESLPLWGGEETGQAEFGTFGYIQRGGFEALHAHGTILGLVRKDESELLQLAPLGQRELDHGYSGAPLWVEGLGVVGIVRRGIGQDKNESQSERTHQDTAFGVPARMLKSFAGIVYEEILKEEAGFRPQKLANPAELPEPGELPPGSKVSFHRNAVFTGRQVELLGLAGSLVERPNAVVVTGMGGIGKTELVVEFCYRYGRYFYGVHWVDARDGSLEAGIAACGQAMGLPDFPEKTPEQVAQTLRAWQSQPRRLVVLDNLEDLSLLEEWLPRLNGLRLLFTSRRQKWSADLGVEAHPIETLPRDESMSLLTKLAKRQVDGLDELAKRLGDLPLALDLAGRYLADMPELSARDFLKEIEGEGGALEHSALKDWAESNPTGHLINLAATFMLSWKRLDAEQDKLARELFIAAGYLAPNVPVPDELFKALGEETGKTVRALRDLVRLGLLAENYSLHPLLAEFARAQDVEFACLDRVSDVMDKISGEAYQTGLPLKFLPFRPHLEALAPRADESGGGLSGALWNDLGQHQSMVAEFGAARKSYERALAIDEEIYGLEHPNVANDANNLGSALQDLGDLAGARALYERALAINEKALGAEHADVANSANNLASLLQELGDLAGAKKLYERALAIDEKAPDPENENLAVRCNNLGRLLQELGELAGAKRLYQRAMAIDEKVHGGEHPSLARDASSLGGILQEEGDLAGAQAQFERAMAIDEKVYGLEHPNVANDANSLGTILHRLGDLAGARQLYERALRMGENFYGPNHPSVAASLNNLGSALQDMGDLAGAQAQFERALAIDEKFYGEEHSNIAIDLGNLGTVRQRLGDPDGAREFYERALAIYEKVYGGEHYTVASELISLGSALQDQGDPQGAKALYERALAIDEKIFGGGHTRVARDANSLGSALQDLGDLAGARARYEQALAIVEKTYGKDHPDVAAAVNNLGTVLKGLGDLAGAKALYERSLAIDEKFYSPDHPDVAIRCSNLGSTRQDLGDLPGAKAYYERALAILQKLLPEGHEKILIMRDNLDSLEEELKRKGG